MHNSLDVATVLGRRETPKINGSSAAFIALVVVLVLIIVVSCTAVIFLLREERAQDEEALRHRHRSREEPSSYPQKSQRWYTRIFGLPTYKAARSGESPSRSDKVKKYKMGRHGQGWVQAGSGNEWDSDSGDDFPSPRKTQNIPGPSAAAMRTRDYDPSLGTPSNSSTAGSPFPYHPTQSRSPHPIPPRVYSPVSDTSSNHSMRGYDPHGVRGLSYPEHYAPSVQGATLPSIASQLYSPPSSPSPSSDHHHYTPANTRRSIPGTSGTLESEPSNDSMNSSRVPPRSFASQSIPSVRTFEGGTKFIEGL
ncbi:unnamed protein product [Cyclocybe aegerita]|uniref:Uncharacterized protein n=1 Tax=Cyclocybe aegerita TaxID=1973307 RepID=A0A8S0WFP5_CYCAE|nr:unnamed protein product [Cyclocybe aegerita]